jgi:type I restriction enzyme S subunit
MQPSKNTAWFAKMRFTDKCLIFTNYDLEKYILSTGFSGIKIKNDYIEFVKYYLMSSYFKYEKDIYSYGTTQESINDTYIAMLHYVKPPYDEQVAIANYLDEKTSKIDSIIESIGKKIEVLKEFRKTLINDVVTGKVKVA